MDTIRPCGVLPAGAGVRFTSDELAEDRVSDASARVRWLDHAGSGSVGELNEAEAAEW